MAFPGIVSAYFNVISHTVVSSHLRQHEYGVVDETKDTYISVNQYIPKSNPNAKDGDLTFICAPGIGMVKELYEPIFEDLARALEQRGVGVRGFWIADPLHSGKSAILNAGNLGNDICWWDHSRDLLQIVQRFRKQMPRPIVGMGHSIGGARICYMSNIHPSLFESLILMEPAIYRDIGGDGAVLMAKMMVTRPEAYPDLNAAIESVKKNPFYRNWDPRAVGLVMQNQFVEIFRAPSAEIREKLFTDPEYHKHNQVATVTPRMMELNAIFHPNQKHDYVARQDDFDATYHTTPHMKAKGETLNPFYQAGGISVLRGITRIRPPVLYIVGDKSSSSTPQIRRERMARTGAGIGGSGGVKAGKVKEFVIPGGNHYVMFHKDHIKTVSNVAADHLVGVVEEFREKMMEKKAWQEQSDVVHQGGDPRLVAALAEYDPRKEETRDIAKILRTKL